MWTLQIAGATYKFASWAEVCKEIARWEDVPDSEIEPVTITRS